jgi:hypothetical protein
LQHQEGLFESLRLGQRAGQPESGGSGVRIVLGGLAEGIDRLRVAGVPQQRRAQRLQRGGAAGGCRQTQTLQAIALGEAPGAHLEVGERGQCPLVTRVQAQEVRQRRRRLILFPCFEKHSCQGPPRREQRGLESERPAVEVRGAFVPPLA